MSFCASPLPGGACAKGGATERATARASLPAPSAARDIGDFWFGAAFGEHTAAVERRGFLYFDAAMFGTSRHRARSSRRSAGGFGVWRAGAGWEKKEREYGTQGSQVITDLSTN